MPGRSSGAAREAFLEPLRRALSCVTTAQLFVPGSKSPGDVEALALSEEPLRLRSTRIDGGVQLKLVQQFRLVCETPTAWHVSTEAYFYRLNDGAGSELISWHWHPQTGVSYPHLHVAAGLLDRRAHLPSGRVSIESVLRLLLTDLGVPPTREHLHDYTRVLDETEATFITHRRWHS